MKRRKIDELRLRKELAVFAQLDDIEARLEKVERGMSGKESEALRKAALAIYSHIWTTPTASDAEQARLWAALRDALGLPANGPNKIRAA